MKSEKKYRLVIRIKKSQKIDGVLLHQEVMNILKKGEIIDATEWIGTGGFGKHGKFYQKIEGMSFDDPVIIESVDDLSKFEVILPMLKDIVNDHGLITLQEITVI